MSSNQRDVLIVGAGIIGLVSAFRLALAKHHVTLFDSAPARGATWAAAGMIAPSAEIAPGELSNYRLQSSALAAWSEVAHEVEDLTGRSMTIARTGTLLVGWDAGDRRLLEQFIHTASEFGAPTQKVSRRDNPRLFEGVTHRIDDGIVMNDDAWINPDEVVSFLLNALDVLGAQIVEQEVLEVHTHARGVSVTCASGEFSADCGILATGARRLPSGVASGAGNAVRPIRGVTVRVQGIDRSDLPTVRAYVRGRAFYMVSRTNGYCVLGASAEERAENVLEVGELQRLLRDALDIIPELETAHLIETRMGLRPASPNLEPFFEVVAPNAWAWSSGHYRHGVTLAPLAALQALSFVEAVA